MNHIFATGGNPPNFPTVNTWSAHLRWLIAVMNDDDKSIGFISGCLSQCVHNDGLTDRQAAGCSKVLKRVCDSFEHLQLDCQEAAE